MKRKYVIALVLVFVVAIGVQVVVAYQFSQRTSELIDDVEQLSNVDDERIRQEAIKLSIENDRRSLFVFTLLSNFGAAVGVVVALGGAWVAFQRNLAERQKTRMDRAAREMAELWSGLGQESERVQAGSVAGMQHFLEEDKRDFHPRVCAALASIARLDNSDSVRQTLMLTVEQAFQKVNPDVIKHTSWQGADLSGISLAERDLSGIDLRDAQLDDADLSECNLANASLDAANLRGADLRGADLTNASLEFADVTRANLVGADLGRARLRGIKIQEAAVRDATFLGADLDHDIGWPLAKDWRNAHLDPELKASLDHRYGPAPEGQRVLMLAWEFPPFVTGGGWTAVHHLIKKAIREGKDVTVLVPWAADKIDRSHFGDDLEVIGVGAGAELAEPGEDDIVVGSYAPATSTTGALGNYATKQYAERAFPSLYLQAYRDVRPLYIIDVVSDFNRRIESTHVLDDLHFDVIHAHDWLTFEAAGVLADRMEIPWIAQFHSTEADRQKRPDPTVVGIEEQAVRHADRTVAVSGIAADKIASELMSEGRETSAIVIPNSYELSAEPPPRRGRFGTGKVLFLGRVSWQKGPDVFVRIAERLWDRRVTAAFQLVGDGDFVKEVSDLIRRTWPQESTEVTERFVNKLYLAEEVILDGGDIKDGIFEPLVEQTAVSGLGEILQVNQNAGITSVQGRAPYTHLLTVPGGRDRASTHFLVAHQTLAGFDLSDAPVRMRPSLDWPNRFRAFDNATAAIVPSRNEPFGMVVLEAMEAGVPVLYAEDAGVAEFVDAGVKIDIGDTVAIADELQRLLNDEQHWYDIVDEQQEAVIEFAKADHPQQMFEIWSADLRSSPQVI